jgi:hypothetical protein
MIFFTTVLSMFFTESKMQPMIYQNQRWKVIFFLIGYFKKNFRLAGGDVKSSGSLKDDSPELARQSTSQLSQQAEPVEQEAPKVIEAKAPEVEQAPEPESAPPPASAAAEEPAPQQPAPAKWFPCCSCCPFCC